MVYINTELNNIYQRYEKRKLLNKSTLYSQLNYDVLMAMQEKERAFVKWIKYAGMAPVHSKKVLEIGCGSGGNLLQFIKMGFNPDNLTGNELLQDKILIAKNRLPCQVNLIPGDASTLDLEEGAFDIVFQSTVFTSVLDHNLQKTIAQKMWKLTKQGGGILWYDFTYDNPNNPDVKGVTIKRIKELFPEGNMKVWRVTLAPPISRLVTKIHPFLYGFFNVFPFLRTHVLCWIMKN